ncbi:glycosyltransferase [Streptomyces sp. ODS28]|uniref:glycosyltransferase n=1 Tax=Streptomyces sp. ODS28 TaxID=3136688 RepID=UPI0031E7D98F
MSAGRLVKAKGFATLIEAFAPLTETHPEWRLRIYGAGPDRDRLRALIHERHLYNHVYLMGNTCELDAELSKASVFALASRHEGFGMVLAEAQSHGVPPVAFDCPNGPREIITDGEDGLLVPLGDRAGLGRALGWLVEDPALRRAMGDRAHESAHRFRPCRIRARWERLLGELAAAKTGVPAQVGRSYGDVGDADARDAAPDQVPDAAGETEAAEALEESAATVDGVADAEVWHGGSGVRQEDAGVWAGEEGCDDEPERTR